MDALKLRPAARRTPILLLGLMGGCGGAAASTPRTAAPSVNRAQAVAFARAVNLRADDVPGFAGAGGEMEGPKPGPYAFEYARCVGGVSPADRIANIFSAEFSSGRALASKLMQSNVTMWPTAAIAARTKSTARSAHARACLVRYIKGADDKINREHGGQMRSGLFTVTFMPKPLPGVHNSFHTRIDETRLHRNGAVFFHIYRDLLGFTSGPAEVELEAIGFAHPVPERAQKRALQMLLERATVNSGALRRQASPQE